jgi:hypothetical protein
LNSVLVNAQNQINGLKAKISDLAERNEDDAELARVHARCAEQPENVEPKWDRAIISVGTGRGFIVQGNSGRYVITAGHCLPPLPACGTAHRRGAGIYQQLLGPIGAQPYVSGECLFADPFYDIAVLGAPRDPTECEKYHTFINAATPLPITNAAPNWSLAWIPSLDGRWLSYAVIGDGGRLTTGERVETVAEMLGSPIVSETGSAIGIVWDDFEGIYDQFHTPISDGLPGWLLSEFGVLTMPSRS